MPLLKSTTDPSSTRNAVVLDLGDLGQQATKLREAARAKAAKIVADAETKAATLVEGAETRGFEQGKQAGLEQGLAEGCEQGRVEAIAAAGEQLQQLQATWGEACDKLDDERADLEREAKQALVTLAVKLAERLVHRQIETDPSVVTDQVAAALPHVLGPVDVAVRLHPDDKPLVEEAMPDLAARFPRFEHVKLVEDDAIDRGGCRVTHGRGEVDATLATQLRRIAEVMLPEAETGEHL